MLGVLGHRSDRELSEPGAGFRVERGLGNPDHCGQRTDHSFVAVLEIPPASP
jgi:hypothetical protein